MAQGLVIVVEGIIGAGKSTLSQELGKALGSDTLTLMEPDEQGNANPYLADFYGDKTRWAFSMQIHLLISRLRMQQSAQWHSMSGRGNAVLDRSYFGDVCFARLMHGTGEITHREFETYRIAYQTMTASVLLPSVCVRLRVDPAVAAERIRRRAEMREGRRSELVIDLGYLESLDREIDSMVSTLEQQGVRVFEVPWTVDRQTPEDRIQAIQRLAAEIVETAPNDLFKLHHQRIMA